LVPLAVTAGRRLPYVPDVPTLTELGHADFVDTAWYSLSGPAALAPEIVETLNHAIAQAIERPQVKRQIEQDAIETRVMSPAELTRFRQSETDRGPRRIGVMMAAGDG